jgi:hypothetical protein
MTEKTRAWRWHSTAHYPPPPSLLLPLPVSLLYTGKPYRCSTRSSVPSAIPCTNFCACILHRNAHWHDCATAAAGAGEPGAEKFLPAEACAGGRAEEAQPDCPQDLVQRVALRPTYCAHVYLWTQLSPPPPPLSRTEPPFLVGHQILRGACAGAPFAELAPPRAGPAPLVPSEGISHFTPTPPPVSSARSRVGRSNFTDHTRRVRFVRGEGRGVSD